MVFNLYYIINEITSVVDNDLFSNVCSTTHVVIVNEQAECLSCCLKSSVLSVNDRSLQTHSRLVLEICPAPWHSKRAYNFFKVSKRKFMTQNRIILILHYESWLVLFVEYFHMFIFYLQQYRRRQCQCLSNICCACPCRSIHPPPPQADDRDTSIVEWHSHFLQHRKA